MARSLTKTRDVLDQLKAAGLTSHDIAARLQLHQVHSNARSVRRWYSGKTNIRNVEYRALCDLLREVNR